MQKGKISLKEETPKKARKDDADVVVAKVEVVFRVDRAEEGLLKKVLDDRREGDGAGGRRGREGNQLDFPKPKEPSCYSCLYARSVADAWSCGGWLIFETVPFTLRRLEMLL